MRKHWLYEISPVFNVLNMTLSFKNATVKLISVDTLANTQDMFAYRDLHSHSNQFTGRNCLVISSQSY